jgi:hypothetical protein
VHRFSDDIDDNYDHNVAVRTADDNDEEYVI